MAYVYPARYGNIIGSLKIYKHVEIAGYGFLFTPKGKKGHKISRHDIPYESTIIASRQAGMLGIEITGKPHDHYRHKEVNNATP